MEKIQKILFHDGHYFAWRKGDMHTEFGVIKETDLKKAKETIQSHLGKEFRIVEPGYNDLLHRAKRGPQIITPKDIGLILMSTDIDKKSTVLEAGSGSGFLTCALARFVKKVISYEKREDFHTIAKENAAFLDLKNITFKHKDITEGIEEKNLDLIVLDMPDPTKALEHAHKALKQGAYFITYLPTINQVDLFIKEAQKTFHLIRVTELLQRDWHVEEQRVRPQSQMIGHTGFLCILRKI